MSLPYHFTTKEETAVALDEKDQLARFRRAFHFPNKNEQTAIYLCGNSLGLQPHKAAFFINMELEKWRNFAVDGHFHAEEPWVEFHKLFQKPMAHIVGAKTSEVVTMNNLTTNLHLMMVSFYRPTKERFKIITEAGAFPSDQYAFESQIKHHGYDPDEALIELKPREGEYTLREEDILQAIEENQEQTCLVLMAGIQYYTGQLFPMQAITEKAHMYGVKVGFDLAHAVGNVPLQLHDWGADFAVWCTYKYLNSGPGNVGGAFVHERHHHNALHRFAGWWGHDEKERFKMEKGFKPVPGADGWQLSNGNILAMAAFRASLEIFMHTGMDALREKSLLLTAYLQYLLEEINKEQEHITIITPSAPASRGCQLSLFIHHDAKLLFEKLSQAGIIVDYREPNVIRVAPAPLYNSFGDVYAFASILKDTLQAHEATSKQTPLNH